MNRLKTEVFRLVSYQMRLTSVECGERIGAGNARAAVAAFRGHALQDTTTVDKGPPVPQVLESLESVLDRRIDVIHLVGGDSRHRLLNQLVANATQRTVIAGPTEATAIGNVLVQAIAAGELKNLSEVA